MSGPRSGRDAVRMPKSIWRPLTRVGARSSRGPSGQNNFPDSKKGATGLWMGVQLKSASTANCVPLS
eukprot:9006513-Alexandrium_andersonii.AAC.1